MRILKDMNLCTLFTKGQVVICNCEDNLQIDLYALHQTAQKFGT